MMKKFLMVGLAALALLGSGCIFSRNDYVESAEFDLDLPKLTSPANGADPGAVSIGVFRNLSGSDRRFLVRRGDGQVVPMEYQRWRMSPELLFQRCICEAFQISVGSTAPRLNATIYRFEFDERGNKAHLSVDFTLVRSPEDARVVRVDVAVPVKGAKDSAAARSAAMGECARLAVEKLSAAMAERKK